MNQCIMSYNSLVLMSVFPSVLSRHIVTVTAALNVRTDHKLSSLNGLMIYCKAVFPRPLGGVSSRSLVGGSI